MIELHRHYAVLFPRSQVEPTSRHHADWLKDRKQA